MKCKQKIVTVTYETVKAADTFFEGGCCSIVVVVIMYDVGAGIVVVNVGLVILFDQKTNWHYNLYTFTVCFLLFKVFCFF